MTSLELDKYIEELFEKSKNNDSKINTLQHYFPKSFLKYFEGLEFDVAQENHFNCAGSDQADKFLTTIESNCYHLFHRLNNSPNLSADSLLQVVSTAKKRATKKEDFLKLYLGLTSLILRSPHSVEYCDGLDFKSSLESLGLSNYAEMKKDPNFKKFCLLSPFCFKLLAQTLNKRAITLHAFSKDQNIKQLTDIIQVKGSPKKSLFKQEFILWFNPRTCIVFENPEISGKTFEIKFHS